MNSSYVVFQTGDDDFRTIKKITKTRSGDVVMVKVRRLRVNVTLCASVRELGDTDVQSWSWVGSIHGLGWVGWRLDCVIFLTS